MQKSPHEKFYHNYFTCTAGGPPDEFLRCAHSTGESLEGVFSVGISLPDSVIGYPWKEVLRNEETTNSDGDKWIVDVEVEVEHEVESNSELKLKL